MEGTFFLLPWFIMSSRFDFGCMHFSWGFLLPTVFLLTWIWKHSITLSWDWVAYRSIVVIHLTWHHHSSNMQISTWPAELVVMYDIFATEVSQIVICMQSNHYLHGCSNLQVASTWFMFMRGWWSVQEYDRSTGLVITVKCRINAPGTEARNEPLPLSNFDDIHNMNSWIP